MKHSSKGVNWIGVALLYFPWLISNVFSSSQLIWWTAWLGSLVIFAWSWAGMAGGVDNKVSLKLRIMHPLYLMQGIFAGYGFVTSIFYWLNLNGISLDGSAVMADSRFLDLAAEVQQYYLLAHASLVFGLVVGSQHQPKRQFRFVARLSRAALLLMISIGAFLLSFIFSFIPGLAQFQVIFSSLGLVATASSLGPSLWPTGRIWLPFSMSLNFIFLGLAALSGWKEEVIVLLILIGIGTFSFFPKSTVVASFVVFMSALIILPIVSDSIRDNSWRGTDTKQEALIKGIQSLQDATTEEIKESIWAFSVERLSEAGMFTRYVASVNSGTPREGLTILKQCLMAPIPRLFWRAKPNLEKQVMERVFNHEVVAEYDKVVSAKPHPVVDAYLIGGRTGIILTFVCIGIVGASIFTFCQSYFGGFLLGGVFFNGLFSILWRGNSLEFMSSSVLWAGLTVIGLNWVFQNFGITQSVLFRKVAKSGGLKREGV